MKVYQRAYQKSVTTVENYQKIFNSQIRIVNQARTQMKDLYKSYQESKMQISSEYDLTITGLDKKRKISLQNLIFGSLSKEEYIRRKNQAILKHNQSITNLESEFLDKMLEIYEKTLNEIVDQLEEI